MRRSGEVKREVRGKMKDEVNKRKKGRQDGCRCSILLPIVSLDLPDIQHP